MLFRSEMFGQEGKMQGDWMILDENEIVTGIDELGVLLYGHGRNAYWYGSQLSIEETRRALLATGDAFPILKGIALGAAAFQLWGTPWL